MLRLLAAGIGIAFLPRLISDQRATPAVRHLLLDEPGSQWNLALAERSLLVGEG